MRACFIASSLIVIMSAVTGEVPVRAGEEGAARPIAVWPAGPIDVVAAFDRPVNRSVALALVGQTIPYLDGGESPSGRGGADRVAGQLRIAAVRLVDGDRTLVIATDPHPCIARYTLPLPVPDRGRRPGATDGPTALYDLSGVEVAWSEEGGDDARPRYTGWWPRLDAGLVQRLTAGSRRHEWLFDQLGKRGRLVITTLIRLPKGAVTVRLDCNQPIDEALLGDAQAEPAGAAGGSIQPVTMKCDSLGEPLFLTATVRTGEVGKPLSLRGTYRIASETTDHPLEAAQLLVPWAPLPAGLAAQSPVLAPDLSGGDPARGRGLFRGDQARCSQCHVFRGEGAKVGPDLNEIARKSRAEIYRSIAAPSAVIDPAYATFTVITRTGKVFAGLARGEGADAIQVTDTNARATLVRRGDIEQIRPSGTSIMPVGLTATLGDSAIRDIIAFLTSPAPGPAPR